MFIYFHKEKNIYYKTKGNGISMVFLHGFMESLEIWNYIYDILSKKYKVLLIDLPGHGKSFLEEKDSSTTTMEEVAYTIKFILQKENIEKAVFIGHSMGGYIALALAEEYPEIFLGLCLLHSTAKSDTKEKKNNRIRSIRFAIDNYPLFVSSSINTLFDPNKLSSFQKELKFLKRIAISTPIHSVTSFLRGMSIRKDRRFFLKRTKFPKLYVVGIYDLILPAKKLREEAKSGYNSYFIDVPTGHMGPIENPQKIVKVLESFMEIIKNQDSIDNE